MVVARWTGREVAALRDALRKNGRDFAAQVGVSHRMLTKWETRGETITPRAGNQAALDTLLATAGPEAQERFAAAITERAAAAQDARAEALLRREHQYTRAAPSLMNDADATMSDNDTGFRCVSRGP